MKFDNGLTDVEQKEMDNKYEELMSKVKLLNLKLYTNLRANELPGFIQNNQPQVNEDDQLEMDLHEVTRFYLEQVQKKFK
tara:strand:+ start:222 stop:461 length:240 start_codon:yes stop_codon:yes gene_type:complete